MPNNTPVNYSNEPWVWQDIGSNAAERLNIIRQFNKNRLPVETLSYNEAESYGFGKSRFDEGAPEWALSDLNEWRAQNQSGIGQIANGIIKGAITTGTTFVNVLAGIPTGIITAAAEGRLSGIWDNAVTNAMQSVTDWSEDVFPNYYTNAQQNAAWYAPENLFSANFLGDKLIKNFGFSAGAGLGMKVVSRIPKLLPKLIKNANIARAVNTAETSFVGAVGEGSIEALNGTKEWAEQNRNIIESERSQNISLIDSKYNQLANDLIRQYGNSELAQQLISNLSIEYQREVDAVNNTANQKVAALQNQIDQQGNLILAGNIPILFGSNLITLGKMMAHGYGAAQSSTNGFVKETILDSGRKGYKSTLTSARQALRYAKTPIAEGLEEMNQAVISTAAKNIAQDYYNMSLDPDATDATKSYMGYIWDSFKQTYGDIDNYEEFVVGMIASGISDIVVGQGKALHDERKQINDAVNRANNAINNFNNRTLLRNMNVQQVLEDQKLDAALRNDKKEYKDSEFGQIASAVIAFSQIGKIDDLKAMIDANLSNMSDDDLETLATNLEQESSNGAEYNAFKLMSNQQRREYLANQKATYDKVISDYNKIREDLISQTGSTFTPEQQAELIFYKLRANNAKSRIDEINNDIDDQILNNTSWDQQTLNKLGLTEDRVYTKQEVLNAIKEFDHSDKQLANLFKGQPVEQLFLDKDRLSKDVNKFNDLVIDFITNPQKLEKKNNKIAQKINDIFTLRKVNNIIDNFSNSDTYSSFASKLNNVDPKLQGRVLNALIKRGVKEAKQFKEKTTFSRYASKFLSESDADPVIVNRAAELISEAIDKGTKKSAVDLNNPLYSKENNSDLSEEDYNKLFSLLGDILNHSSAESAEPITKKSPLEKEPVPTEESEEDLSLQGTTDRISKLLNDTQEEEEEVKPQQPKPSTFVESTEEKQYKTTEENTKVLGVPLANNNGNNTDKDIDSSKTNSVKNDEDKKSEEFLSPGFQRIDTKKYLKDKNGEKYLNPYVGIPIIERRDKDGKLTKEAKELTPIYNRVKELGAFDNVEHGVVKVDSKVFYAIDPTLKGDHVVEGETITYNDAPILLYVDDKCVGSLTNEQATSLGIREKLEEEFAGSSNDSIHISKRYFTNVKEIWAGRVKYEKEGSWPITNDSLSDIKERMAGPDTNANDVNPIITVFDPNSNAFVNSNSGIKYHLGQQVSDIFEDRFYKGSVVLLVPTAAYDNTKVEQPEHAFMPVRLERIKADSLDPNSKTKTELRKLIRSIFNKNTTAEQLDKIVGDIKKLITYNYHISPTEEVSVHIDPGAMTSEGKISPTTNHSYFKTNNLDQAKSTFTYIILKYKVGNNDVKTFTMNTHLGNVKTTSSLSKETIDQYVQKLEDVFLKDLNSYVNINKNELIDPKYVQKLIDDKVLRTNVKDFTVRGDSFTMEPEIYDTQSETQPEEPKQPKVKVERQPETKQNIVPDADDDIMNYRRESLRVTSDIIDIDKEVNEVMRMLPQLDRDTVFETVKTLIDINESDDKAMGQFFKGIIKLSELAESGTAYHEAYHLVFNMILKPEEVNKLLKEYSKKYPDLNPIQLEEQMAEDFRDYAMTRESVGVEKGILAWFKRLAELVKALFDGRYYFETVASKIWRSKYSGRKLHPTKNVRNSKVEDDLLDIEFDDEGNIFFVEKQPSRRLNNNIYATHVFKNYYDITYLYDGEAFVNQLIDSTRYHDLGLLFRKKLNNIKNIKFFTGVNANSSTAGTYYSGTNEIIINTNNKIINSKAETLIHEFIHAATVIEYQKNTVFAEKINDLYAIAVTDPKYGRANYNWYGYEDPLEFISEAFANKQFADHLKRIKYKREENILEAIINYIKQIFGVYNNIYEELFNTTIKYITINNSSETAKEYPNINASIYEEPNGINISVYNHTYWVEDLSKERFQRLVDSQVNNQPYNIKTRYVDMNNQWGKLIDEWKVLGVNITGHKYNGKYTVDKVDLDYNNTIIRNIEQYKQNRNRTLLDEKTKQCEY